jgi:hypothetical protein
MNCPYLDLENMQYHNIYEPRLKIMQTILLSHEDVGKIVVRVACQ